ncbi:sensor histidine kinase [Mucilaginibacter sp. UYCu711]|uniref:sensor histidine kinase n=1 Tax=Mucilaginibacter sp. UYCu711 TaxID=3156339 RepID=UPI003D224EBD
MHKPFLFNIKLAAFLLFICAGLKAQDSQIKPAFDFPTKEVYDLHVDRHGFVWIASDYGVARYDGINCVHFSSPLQISLGCTNLLEDNYGRIWFNNFNGQIFYIDHETVTLLKSYNYKNESNFPRLVLFHDQLLATSDKGLFVLDTRNLTGRYISTGTYTSSLAVLKDQVLVHGDKKWYSYTGGAGLKKLAYSGDDQIPGNVYTVAPNTYKDTVYMMSNPSGIVKKLLLQNDTVKQYRQLKFNGFINTLSITAGNQWVNTNGGSYSLKNGEKITGYNLSDIVTDLEGNRWLSSLFYGLLIQPKKDIANKTIVPALADDDLVVSIRSYKEQLLLGTQQGFLMLYDPVSKNIGFKLKVSATVGSIFNITAISADEYIVGCAIATYMVNIPTQTVTELADINSVKQVSYDDKAIYIAATSGVFILPKEKSDRLNRQLGAAFGQVLKYSPAGNYFYLRQRSRAIAYFPDQAALFVTFKNKLFKIDKNGMNPFLFNNNEVYAASLACLDHRLYIGTISNGMLVVEKNEVKHISAQNGLFSRSIFKLKPTGKNLWILGSGPLQLFNTQKSILVDNYTFPDRSASQVFDLDLAGQRIYLATPTGLDNFPLVKNADKRLKNYLLSVKVNNQTATANSSRKLAYTENNVLFNIGVPAYLKAKDIYIKYCLATKTDSTWLTTEPGERTIRFSSLMPGNYSFKAIAVDPRLGVADTMISYDFTIAEPWWGGIGFKIVLVFVFLAIILYGYVTMLRKRLALKKAFDTQQQLILAERQRISAEMHDDIGSGVFAIHSFAHAAGKKENAGPEISEIENMVTDLSVKIRDVIWSTNVGYDNLENLFYYTYLQINKLFEHSEIKLVYELPEDIIDLKITGLSRRNIYLLVKELVHNAIKHSKASTIAVKTFADEQTLYIAVNDNGVGINPDNARPNGMGLGNIRQRVEKFDGTLSIENNEGAHINIKIPLSALQVVEFDKKLNKWQLFITRLLRIPTGKEGEK